MQKKKYQNKTYKCVKNRIKQTNTLGFSNACVYAKQKINLTWPYMHHAMKNWIAHVNKTNDWSVFFTRL